jgi:hypothetical protein
MVPTEAEKDAEVEEREERVAGTTEEKGERKFCFFSSIRS